MLIGLGAHAWCALAEQGWTSAGRDVVNRAFVDAARESGVPTPLLKALCYLEGHLSAHGGYPSLDNGYGCMHIIQNARGDELDRAAHLLGVSADTLKHNLPINIRAGAALLRAEAVQLSPVHRAPTGLADWYGAVAAYSHAATRADARMYADAVYVQLSQGLAARADDGEMITLAPQRVQSDVQSSSAIPQSQALPSGCQRDQNVDYPQAIDCLVSAHTFDCNQTAPKAPCTYEGAQRPTDFAIDQIVIHDIEGNAQSSLRVFQNPQNQASVQYIVDSDGTVYQVVREKNIAYHAGNYWYNQHSIGIEHAGVDASGYRWYNASEYLASAKLVAYLLAKYHLPLNHEQIVSHGTIPSPSATSLPNHVDPGPYWLWDYYLKLIHAQGVHYPGETTVAHIFQIRPDSDRRPLGPQGQEASANFNFFYLYNGPSTKSGRIPALGGTQDITNVNGCVEPDVSYYYLDKVNDPAGSGTTLYKIWYGVVDQTTKAGRVAHARLVWLAVPHDSSGKGEGSAVTLQAVNGQKPLIYGQPTSGSSDVIGDAPAGAVFASTYTVTEDVPSTTNQGNPGNPGSTPVAGTQNTGDNPGAPNPVGTPTTGGSTNGSIVSTEPASADDQPAYENDRGTDSAVHPANKGKKNDGTGRLWYEINYNHRQAWVPASEVTLSPGA